MYVECLWHVGVANDVAGCLDRSVQEQVAE